MDFDPARPLTITCSWTDRSQVVVAVAGELDLAAAPRLAAVLVMMFGHDATEPLLKPRPEVVVVDLAGLRLLSAAGLAVLYDAHEQAARNNIRLRVVTGSGEHSPARRVLNISGLAAVLDVYGCRPVALAVRQPGADPCDRPRG